jgi:squalene-hopene/tetraprenyl-beta-curcumene cyclase
VPDADDTAGALLALHTLAGDRSDVRAAAERGVGWLIGLANRDGGVPTFCRGWGKLPFDRSSPDLTAHALAALTRWSGGLPGGLARRARSACSAAETFLAAGQAADGSWEPLWFGNQHAPREANPTYGTARVVAALLVTGRGGSPPAQRGVDWLLAAQNADGGWGGAPGAPSSIEETAVAVEALAQCPPGPADEPIRRGAAWLIDRTDRGRSFPPAPIGLYFAKLWYFERLYPLIFTVAALGRVARRGP